MNNESNFSIRIKGLKDVPEEVKNLLFELAGRLSDQEKKYSAQQQKLLSQEQKLSEQEQKILDQNQKILNQDQKISNQEQKISNQEQQLLNQEQQLSEQNRRLLEKTSELEEKKAQISELEIEIENLKELLKLRTAVKFVPSSEILPSLFDEAEILAPPLNEKEQEEEVQAYKRAKRKKQTFSSVPADTPVEVFDHCKEAQETIERTFNGQTITFNKISDFEVVYKSGYVPARIVVEEHRYPKYKSTCSGEGIPETIVEYGNPEIDRLACAHSLVSNVGLSKYDDHLPLYRQEEMFNRLGFDCGRQKLAQWLIKYYVALMPLETLMLARLYKSSFINMDESRHLVLDVKNSRGRPSKTGAVFIRIGSTYNRESRKMEKIVLMSYIKDKKIETLLEDHRRFKYQGGTMTDGLKAYLHLDPGKHCACWVHAVRDFKSLLKSNSKNEDAKNMCLAVGKLYTIENDLRAKLFSGEITPEVFLSERASRTRVVFDEIARLKNEMKGRYSPGSTTGKALAYLDCYWPSLINYTSFLEATPDNNASELRAKAFATGRKNWLFSKSEDGADASEFFFSLIETAKENNLNPGDYLEYVCSKGPYCKTKEEWETLLPWNADLSSVREAKAGRLAATADKNRKAPYKFTGATR